MIKEAVSVINQMQADGIIKHYAIGGAIGATFYLEPVSTVDLDIFVAIELQPAQFIISLQPVYDYLKAKNAVPEGEYILIAGWPVLFLVPDSPLVEEALDSERFLKIVQKHHLTNKWRQFEQQFLGADNL